MTGPRSTVPAGGVVGGTTAAATATPLIPRLQDLAEALAQEAVHGRCGVVCISGGGASGKRAIANEFLTLVRPYARARLGHGGGCDGADDTPGTLRSGGRGGEGGSSGGGGGGGGADPAHPLEILEIDVSAHALKEDLVWSQIFRLWDTTITRRTHNHYLRECVVPAWLVTWEKVYAEVTCSLSDALRLSNDDKKCCGFSYDPTPENLRRIDAGGAVDFCFYKVGCRCAPIDVAAGAEADAGAGALVNMYVKVLPCPAPVPGSGGLNWPTRQLQWKNRMLVEMKHRWGPGAKYTGVRGVVVVLGMDALKLSSSSAGCRRDGFIRVLSAMGEHASVLVTTETAMRHSLVRNVLLPPISHVEKITAVVDTIFEQHARTVRVKAMHDVAAGPPTAGRKRRADAFDDDDNEDADIFDDAAADAAGAPAAKRRKLADGSMVSNGAGVANLSQAQRAAEKPEPREQERGWCCWAHGENAGAAAAAAVMLPAPPGSGFRVPEGVTRGAVANVVKMFAKDEARATIPFLMGRAIAVLPRLADLAKQNVTSDLRLYWDHVRSWGAEAAQETRIDDGVALDVKAERERGGLAGIDFTRVSRSPAAGAGVAPPSIDPHACVEKVITLSIFLCKSRSPQLQSMEDAGAGRQLGSRAERKHYLTLLARERERVEALRTTYPVTFDRLFKQVRSLLEGFHGDNLPDQTGFPAFWFAPNEAETLMRADLEEHVSRLGVAQPSSHPGAYPAIDADRVTAAQAQRIALQLGVPTREMGGFDQLFRYESTM